jgi:hypothetical protein
MKMSLRGAFLCDEAIQEIDVKRHPGKMRSILSGIQENYYHDNNSSGFPLSRE